ncbi:MAG: OprD family porin [Epsilonproteobacteria bacterium]|nr:OprD family porin [Campylobacterota bacterium]
MKTITFSLLTAAMLVPSMATADSLADAFANGKTSGQIRAFYIDRDRSGTVGDTQTDRSALAAGGHLKFETAELNGFSLGTALYTTNGILGVNGSGDDKRNATLFGEGKESYSILGEAYVQYKTGNTALKIGRQKLNTPLAGADDARMLPNLFEAAVLSNSDIENTTLIAAHVTKMAAGTFSNAYGGNALSLHSGYGLNNISGEFMDMGEYAVGRNSVGVSALAAIYKGIEGVTLQAWDYYAHDILNAIYLQADASWKCKFSDNVKPFASAQYLSQSDIGDKFAGDVDSQYMGVKAGAGVGNVKAYVAYSQTGDSDGATNGGIITPWGGMPAFTQGMVTRHMFFADTTATKVAATYNLAGLGVKGSATAYYAKYDVGAKNAVKADTAFEAKESGFDLQYYPASVKNLQLRLRGNFPTEFVPGLDWSEYRLIANYSF